MESTLLTLSKIKFVAPAQSHNATVKSFAVPQEHLMNTRAIPDLSTIEVARLDPASLRLVTRAVEIEARRLRAQAMRDLLSQAVSFFRKIVSARTTSNIPAPLHAHAR
jgi:hypothetical protein